MCLAWFLYPPGPSSTPATPSAPFLDGCTLCPLPASAGLCLAFLSHLGFLTFCPCPLFVTLRFLSLSAVHPVSLLPRCLHLFSLPLCSSPISMSFSLLSSFPSHASAPHISVMSSLRPSPGPLCRGAGPRVPSASPNASTPAPSQGSWPSARATWSPSWRPAR